MFYQKFICLILISSLFCFPIFTEENKTAEIDSEQKPEAGEIATNEEINSEQQNKKNEQVVEEKKEEKPAVSDEFYSIQSSSLTACYGSKWFLEEFNDKGQITTSVLYDKDTLIEKKEFFYTDNYKSGVNILTADKLIKIKYNKSGYEIENAVYDKAGENIIEKRTNRYNANNLLVETALLKDETETSSTFTYGRNKKKLTQTDFIDNEKVCFIEFKPTKKIIHLFKNEKEIKILEEEF